MKKISKLFLLFTAILTLTLCMCLSTSAIAESGSLGNDVTYTYDSKTGNVVIGGTGAMKDYPDNNSSSRTPFYNCDLNNVIVEDGVTEIGNNLFYCASINGSLTIGADVKRIGDDLCSFRGNSITVSEDNNCYFNDEYGALFNKEGTLLKYPVSSTATSYIIPNGVKAIAYAAFCPAVYLENIELPDTLREIGEIAFESCIRLKEINIPDSVISIGEEAFGWCHSLEKVNLSKGMASISDKLFNSCYSLKEVYIPSSIKEIGGSSFAWCFSLEKVVVPETVEFISWTVFDSCVNLNDLYIYGDNTEFDYLPYGFGEIKVDENKISRKDFAEKCKLFATETNPDVIFEEIESLIISAGEEPDPLATIHAHPGSTAEAYAKENGIRFVDITNEEIFDADEKTGITADFEPETFHCIPDLVITEGGKNSNFAFGSLFGRYTSYDISFEIAGEKVQPNGMVTIRIPLPDGYNKISTNVYYVDDLGNKTKLPSSIEGDYIVFETDHFSEYVIVDESSALDEPSTEPDEPTTDKPTTEPDAPSQTPEDDNCSCGCHKTGFMGFIYKIIIFFWKLFKINPVCSCGIAHY